MKATLSLHERCCERRVEQRCKLNGKSPSTCLPTESGDSGLCQSTCPVRSALSKSVLSSAQHLLGIHKALTIHCASISPFWNFRTCVSRGHWVLWGACLKSHKLLAFVTHNNTLRHQTQCLTKYQLRSCLAQIPLSVGGVHKALSWEVIYNPSEFSPCLWIKMDYLLYL